MSSWNSCETIISQGGGVVHTLDYLALTIVLASFGVIDGKFLLELIRALKR